MSWLLQIFPVLGRRRSLAVRLHALGAARYPEQLTALPAGAVPLVLHSIADQLSVVRVDLSQTPESYYYREGEASSSLGHNISVAVRLVEAARASGDPAVRLAGEVLDATIGELVECLRSRFLTNVERPGEVLDAFAREHD